jgi:sortase A
MALYCYIKALPATSLIKPKPQILVKGIKFLPYISLFGGLLLLMVVLMPLMSHKLLLFSKNQTRILSPLPQNLMAEAKDILSPVKPAVLSAQTKTITPQYEKEVDFHLIQNWFPTAPLPRVKPSKITNYTISIPKLKIKDANVTIGSTEIKSTLIHYPGTALPGEYGNTVIFGHSVLPIFYNPKNYEAIFSTIPTLDKSDEIFIYFDGIEYKYQVEDYLEVEPDNITVLEQRFNEQVLSLVTCVPPGTYKERGVIKARLAGL